MYEDIVDAANASTPWHVHGEADETLQHLRTSPLRDLANARAPTLIVHGAQDHRATASVIRRVHDASGASLRRVCEVPGGHEDVHATDQPGALLHRRLQGGPCLSRRAKRRALKTTAPNLATPRGSAQCETVTQVLEFTATELWRDRFDSIRLTA